MKLSIADAVALLDYQELLALDMDVAHGSLGLRKIVQERITRLETTHQKHCASCGTLLCTDNHCYTLVFGPSELRKKATCCGMDCFEQFVAKIKTYEAEVMKHAR
jgi:hypothetical protein